MLKALGWFWPSSGMFNGLGSSYSWHCYGKTYLWGPVHIHLGGVQCPSSEQQSGSLKGRYVFMTHKLIFFLKIRISTSFSHFYILITIYDLRHFIIVDFFSARNGSVNNLVFMNRDCVSDPVYSACCLHSLQQGSILVSPTTHDNSPK